MQADYEDCAAVVRTGLPAPEFTNEGLQRVLDSEALSGLWMALIGTLARQGRCELLATVLKSLRHDASRASRTLLAALPYSAYLRGSSTGVLYQELLSLFYQLSAENAPGETLDTLWRALQKLPRGNDDEQYRLAAVVLSKLLDNSCENLETASLLLVKALALPVSPLLYAATWATFLEAAAVLWQRLRQRYTAPGPLRSVLAGLKVLADGRREKAAELFPREVLLMALLRVLRVGVPSAPSFGDTCWFVVLLRTALLQLERARLLSVLAEAGELLQTSEPVWLAAAVAGQSLVLLQFFLQQTPAREPRLLQQLLELALCNVFRDQPSQFSVVLSSVPPLLCIAALLGAGALGANWLGSWTPGLEVAWGVWCKVRARLATTGHTTPAKTVAFLQKIANDSGRAESDGDSDQEEEQERDRCADCVRLGAKHQELSADCVRLGAKHQELSNVRAELAKEEATAHELSGDVARKQQQLQSLEQKLRTSRRCLRRLRTKEKSLQMNDGKGSAAAIRLLRAIDPLQWADGEDVSALASALAAADELRQKLASEHERLRQLSCVVCMEYLDSGGRRLVVLFPCGHAQLCAGCAAQLKACPLCRRAIERYVAPV